jgi:hypothetical protein
VKEYGFGLLWRPQPPCFQFVRVRLVDIFTDSRPLFNPF